jgi:hypothetical protein
LPAGGGARALAFADVLKQQRPEPYKRMYDDHRDTGLFSSDTLRRVGQGSKGRFGLLGLRVMETLYGDVRVYGSIAWEGMQELRIARDSTTEEPVTMHILLARSAQDLVAKLP